MNCKLGFVTSGYFVTIEPDECRRLLGDARVGRVGWVSPTAGLQVLPVSYALSDGRIVFTVSAESLLAELRQPVDVVFQVDDLDQATATGWSVLARGTTVPFEGDPASLAHLPWAPGVRDVPIAIAVGDLTGRSVSSDGQHG